MNETEAASRTEILLGKEALFMLQHCRVAVFGCGGVGSGAIEALARIGIGALDIIDHDTICPSNLNRQLLATAETIGMLKVEAAKARIHAINPAIVVRTYPLFYLPPLHDQFPFADWDYIIDAVDTVTAKLDIIRHARETHTPIISCMGCGNRLYPTKLDICDLYETKNDPLARIMRHECRKLGVRRLKVVCSREVPLKPQAGWEYPSASDTKRPLPGSVSFVPPVAGMMAASAVVHDLLRR